MIDRTWASTAALVALFVACALAGGPGTAADSWAAGAAAILRRLPAVLDATLVLTWLGSAVVTLPLALLGALALAKWGQKDRAVILLVTVTATRLSVDGLKLCFARARPVFDAQLAHIHSLSFPSGHSANSLVTYGLLAALLAPGRSRPLIAALAVAAIVGLTRIILGVHWLSDVVGGWAFGLLTMMLALAAERRLAAHEQ